MFLDVIVRSIGQALTGRIAQKLVCVGHRKADCEWSEVSYVMRRAIRQLQQLGVKEETFPVPAPSLLCGGSWIQSLKWSELVALESVCPLPVLTALASGPKRDVGVSL